MRRLAFLLGFLSISSFVYSQCEAPVVTDWVSTSDTTFLVSFDASIEAPYELEVRLDYGELNDFPNISSFTIEGNSSVGSNEITVDVSESGNINDYSRIYFTAVLRLECETNVFSDSAKFYLSSHSLLNDPTFLIDNVITPFEPLPDGAGMSYQTIFTIPDEGEFIESLAVFLDLGHTWNGDLSISLTHPNGTEVTLLQNSNGLGGSFGLSVVFTDLAEAYIENGENEDNGPRGIFLPFESFSSLIGEPLAGDWVLTVTDNLAVDDGMVFGISLDINGTFCASSISGAVYVDINENETLDSDDYTVPYPLISNSISGSTFFGFSSGHYFTCSSLGAGELSLQNIPNYYEADPIPIAVQEGDALNGLDIIVSSEEDVDDLIIDIFSLLPNRPGFPATYLVHAQNLGTTCQEGVTIDFEFPEYVSVTESNNPDVVIDGTSGTLTIDEVCPFEIIEFDVDILLDDTVSLGTILEATASIVPVDDDITPENNSFTSEVEVVGSYDPNDKQVSATEIEAGFMENESPLKYTVRFQNTGTFYAERVVIVDTLDANLDLSSLNILSASHNMEATLDGNVLTLDFDNIFLPDSTTDLEGSQGFVRYEITPNPSFSLWQTIENTAYIFFDFNAPIITNTVVTEYVEPLSAGAVKVYAHIYPNPVSDELIVKWNSEFKPNRLEVFDLTGRKVLEENIRSTELVAIQVEELVNGVYILQLSDGLNTSSNRFVKVE